MLREAEYPDEFANILFDAAICLSEIKTIVKRNYIYDGSYFDPFTNQPRYSIWRNPNAIIQYTSFKTFFNTHKGYISNYSDEFFSRMDSTQLTIGGQWVVDFFVELYSDFKELTVEELIKLRELAEPLPDIIKSFMPQHEILEKIRIESDRRWQRDAQDKFLGGLVSAFESPIIANSWAQNRENRKLTQIYRKFILGDFRFRIIQKEITYQADYPYYNWLDNIPDLMLNYFNCYINMINTLIQLPERLEREKSERLETKKRRQKKKRLKSIAKKKARTLSLRRLREEKGEDLQIRTQSQELPEIVRIKERTAELKEKRETQKKHVQSTSKYNKPISAGKKVKITRKYNK
jgi:hypothetical protein